MTKERGMRFLAKYNAAWDPSQRVPLDNKIPNQEFPAMRTVCVSLFTWIALAGCLFAEEPAKGKVKSPKEIVEAGVLQFYQRMASDDAQVREKELDAVIPDQKTLAALLGDDAELIWSRFADLRKQIIAQSDRAKQEADHMGKIVSVEAVDIRQEEGFGKYDRMLEVIPQNIPVYRAKIQFAKSTGGASFYVVIDGHMKFVRGLDGMVKYIDEQKKNKP